MAQSVQRKPRGEAPTIVIIQHYPHSAQHYAETDAGGLFPIPAACPDCGAVGTLLRWGFYDRQARMGLAVYHIRVQRVRCTACEHTHILLPDFLHPYRHYVLSLLQRVVSLYLFGGLGIDSLLSHLLGQGPARSTIREWIASFAYGAGELLYGLLAAHVLAMAPLADLPESPPPDHLDCVPGTTKRHRLANAYHVWRQVEHLCAAVKKRLPYLHFAAAQLLPFLLHWLQEHQVIPRIFWSPRLATTPTTLC